MARLLEHHGLDILKASDMTVPRYVVVATPEAAQSAAETFGGRAVVKALIPVGKRGKAGAIRPAETPQQAAAHAAAMLGREVLHFPVNELLVAEMVAVKREFFASISFDSMERCPIVLFSAEGGVDVEELFGEAPAALIRRAVPIGRGLHPFQAREITRQAGLSGQVMINAAAALHAMYRAFVAIDAQTVEVNPLALTEADEVVAVSTAIIADDQAFFRHPEISAIAEAAPTNGWRPLTPLERRMREIDATDPGSSVRFNEFEDGRIGFMVTGGGAGFLALDHIFSTGGAPATSFDITPGRVEEKMYLATKAILAKPGLKGLLVGGNISNFIPIDVKVRGVMKALRELKIDPRRFPIVFRFAGPGTEESKKLAGEIPGIVFVDASGSIEEAVDRIVELTKSP